MSIIRVKARALIGAAVIADGLEALRRPTPHEAVAAPLVAKFNDLAGRNIATGQVVRALAIGDVVGGGLVATSAAPRLGAAATLAASVPAVLFGYRFWEEKADTGRRGELRAGFFYHLALVGAALLVLAGPNGKRTRRRNKADKKTGRRP
ncbi:MAG: hypothetical protein LBO20_04425 [Bifidobacteriaceae bacterium]|jgi:uncharacterized membrane protein YphA (DoxX/SURF4 family)|nr:hypothetical protein [Bifidobacteriaceae bacterium]